MLYSWCQVCSGFVQSSGIRFSSNYTNNTNDKFQVQNAQKILVFFFSEVHSVHYQQKQLIIPASQHKIMGKEFHITWLAKNFRTFPVYFKMGPLQIQSRVLCSMINKKQCIWNWVFSLMSCKIKKRVHLNFWVFYII